MPATAPGAGTTQPAQVAGMAEAITPFPLHSHVADRVNPLPEVRLEVRGGPRATVYTLADIDFLIGSVPGCDLRVPGAELPAVLCLVARQASRVTLRKLAPTQAVLVNGLPITSTALADGDRIAVGAVELAVQIQWPPLSLAREETDAPGDEDKTAITQAVAVAKQKLREQLADFQTAVTLAKEVGASNSKRLRSNGVWNLTSRRPTWRRVSGSSRNKLRTWRTIASSGTSAASRSNCAMCVSSFVPPPAQTRPVPNDDPQAETAHRDWEQRERALAVKAEELTRRQTDVEIQAGDLARQKQELASHRQEVADIRTQLYDRYRERRDRLAGLQEAVDRAARKVQENKRRLETEIQQAAACGAREDEARHNALENRAAELTQAREQLEEERRQLDARHKEHQEVLVTRLADCDAREAKVSAEAASGPSSNRPGRAPGGPRTARPAPGHA